MIMNSKAKMYLVRTVMSAIALTAIAKPLSGQTGRYATQRAAPGDSVTVTVAEVDKLDQQNAVIEMLRIPDDPQHVYLIISKSAKPEDLNLALSRLSASAASSVEVRRGFLQGFIYADTRRKPVSADKERNANAVVAKLHEQGTPMAIPRHATSKAVRIKLPLTYIVSKR